VAGARERGLPAHCRAAGSSPRPQLPMTGWELQASARLPWPSWRWARQRGWELQVRKKGKNNVWAEVKKVLGDNADINKQNSIYWQVVKDKGILFWAVEWVQNIIGYKAFIFHGTLNFLSSPMEWSSSIGGLNASPSLQGLATQWKTNVIWNCLMHYLSNNQGSEFILQIIIAFVASMVDSQDKPEFRAINCLCFFWQMLSLEFRVLEAS